MRFLIVLAGGGLGSLARYSVGLWVVNTFGSSFPLGTVLVNVTGSFLIGLIATLADESGAIGSQARLFLVVGILGGFTTFSSFSLEAWRLAEEGDAIRAILYVSLNLLLGGAAAIAGVLLARAAT